MRVAHIVFHSMAQPPANIGDNHAAPVIGYPPANMARRPGVPTAPMPGLPVIQFSATNGAWVASSNVMAAVPVRDPTTANPTSPQDTVNILLGEPSPPPGATTSATVQRLLNNGAYAAERRAPAIVALAKLCNVMAAAGAASRGATAGTAAGAPVLVGAAAATAVAATAAAAAAAAAAFAALAPPIPATLEPVFVAAYSMAAFGINKAKELAKRAATDADIAATWQRIRDVFAQYAPLPDAVALGGTTHMIGTPEQLLTGGTDGLVSVKHNGAEMLITPVDDADAEMPGEPLVVCALPSAHTLPRYRALLAGSGSATFVPAGFVPRRVVYKKLRDAIGDPDLDANELLRFEQIISILYPAVARVDEVPPSDTSVVASFNAQLA